MNETPFYMTKPGRQYYEVTMPELVGQLHRLNDILGLLVELVEKHMDCELTDQCDDQEE